MAFFPFISQLKTLQNKFKHIFKIGNGGWSGKLYYQFKFWFKKWLPPVGLRGGSPLWTWLYVRH